MHLRLTGYIIVSECVKERYDLKGIIGKEFVPEGRTINNQFYLEIIERLLQRIFIGSDHMSMEIRAGFYYLTPHFHTKH
jgi:hypothetical protein